MIQRFVPIVNIFQYFVFTYHGLGRAKFLEDTLDLEGHVETSGRKEAAETESIALAEFEGYSFVEEGIV
jgi:hypothetical protein